MNQTNHRYVIVKTDLKYEIWDTCEKRLMALVSTQTSAKLYCANLNAVRIDEVSFYEFLSPDIYAKFPQT